MTQPVHPDDTPLQQRKGGSYVKPKPEPVEAPPAEEPAEPKTTVKKGR